MQNEYCVRGWGESGQELFYAIDSSSRYPYASSFAKKTGTLEQAVNWLQECGPDATFCKMRNPEVVKIVYEPVDINDFISQRAELEKLITGMEPEKLKILKGMLK